MELLDEALLIDSLGLAFGGRFLLTLGGRTYSQVSPLVLHSEQFFSEASLVQHIFRFRHASHLGKVSCDARAFLHNHPRSFLPRFVFAADIDLGFDRCPYTQRVHDKEENQRWDVGQ